MAGRFLLGATLFGVGGWLVASGGSATPSRTVTIAPQQGMRIGEEWSCFSSGAFGISCQRQDHGEPLVFLSGLGIDVKGAPRPALGRCSSCRRNYRYTFSLSRVGPSGPSVPLVTLVPGETLTFAGLPSWSCLFVRRPRAIRCTHGREIVLTFSGPRTLLVASVHPAKARIIDVSAIGGTTVVYRWR